MIICIRCLFTFDDYFIFNDYYAFNDFTFNNILINYRFFSAIVAILSTATFFFFCFLWCPFVYSFSKTWLLSLLSNNYICMHNFCMIFLNSHNIGNVISFGLRTLSSLPFLDGLRSASLTIYNLFHIFNLGFTRQFFDIFNLSIFTNHILLRSIFRYCSLNIMH